jgi:hypothetical protein
MNGNIQLSDEELFKNMLEYMYNKGVTAILAMQENKLDERGKDYIQACHNDFCHMAIEKCLKEFKIQ